MGFYNIDRVFHLVFLIILLSFNSKLSYSEVNKTKSVFFHGQNYYISIPNGYCDISDTATGKILSNHIKAAQKNIKIKTPEVKLIFANCDYILGNIYPWGYVGMLIKEQNFSQKLYNEVVSKLFSNKNLMQDLSEITNKALDKSMNTLYGENRANSDTIQKPEIIYKDNFSVIFRSFNSGNFAGEFIKEVVVGSSTVLRESIINTYITNEFGKEPNSFYLAGSLIENSKINYNLSLD